MKTDNIHVYSKAELSGILIVAAFAAFLTPFFGAVVNIAIPSIATSFHVPSDMLAMLTTAYLISTVVFMIPASRLADIYGLEKVFLTGLIIGFGSSLLASFAPSFEILMICHILTGLGFSCVISNAIAVVSATFPIDKRGGAIGITVAFVYLGLTAGPLFGGVLIGFFNWHSVYLFTAFVSLVTAVLGKFAIRHEIISAKNETFDLKGSVLYGITIFLIMFGLTRLPDPFAGVMILLGAAFLFVFIKFERKQKYPVFAIRLFESNPVFVRGNIVTMINYWATYAVSFFMSLYLQVIGLLTPAEAGFMMVAMPVMQMTFSPVFGRLSDKISGRILMTIGMLITAIGMAFLLFASETFVQLQIILNLALIGFGLAVFSAPNTNLVLSSVPKKDNGSANGINATMRQMGMVVSMAVATCFLAMYYSEGGLLGDPSGLVTAMHMAFGVGAVLCFVGSVVSWYAKSV